MEDLDSLLSLRLRWWAPFFTSTAFGSLCFFVLPSMALIALNSRSTALAVIGGGALALPWAVARLHWISPFFPVTGFYLLLVLAWMLQPAEWEGNPKFALASYLMPWLLLSVAYLAASCALLLKRRYRI